MAKFCRIFGITISVEDQDLICVAQLEGEYSERKTTPVTFEEHRERKGKERTSRFVSESSKKSENGKRRE